MISVISVFDWLTDELGVEIFQELFPLILTDNSVEFQNPERLECNKYGEKRTSVYYCNLHRGNNHEYIRLVIPKGKNMDVYTQEDIFLLMNNINYEARDSLNGWAALH